MSYTYARYHLYHVDHLTPRTTAEWQQLNNTFQSVVQSASQEKILAAFPKLETRWDSTDRRVNDWRPPPVPEPPPHPATYPLHIQPPWATVPPHPPSSWDPAFQPTDLSGQQWYPNVGYTDHQYGHQPPHGQNQYSLPPFELRTTSRFQPPPTPPYFSSALSTPYQTSEYHNHQFEYHPPLVQDQYPQPHHSNPNVVEQNLDPYYRLEAYQQRADDQLPAQPPYMGFNLSEPPPHLDTRPLSMPRDTMTPNLEPNLSLEAVVSQLQRLTTDIEQLVSRMDANERRLGDPHTAMRPPPAPPFSLHDSAAPYTVQPHINPDIAGNLQQPPTQRSPPWNHDIRYGSIESLADDIHAHESVQSRQIHYLSDHLLNRDPIGDEDDKNVLHSSVDVSGSIYGSKDDIYVSCNVVFARREPTHVVEHNRVDIALLCNKFNPFLLKEDGDGSIGEVKKVITSFNVDRVPSRYIVENCWVKREGAYTGLQVIAFVYVVWHVGDVTSLTHRSIFFDADARLIPPCNDMQYLGTHGCVDRLLMLTLNSHKHNLRMGQKSNQAMDALSKLSGKRRMGIILEMARELIFPFTSVAHQQIHGGCSHEGKEEENATLLKVWKEISGVTIVDASNAKPCNLEDMAKHLYAKSVTAKLIGFIKLGLVGFGMATHLLNSYPNASIAPTNVAILGVVKKLLSCLSEKLVHMKYGFGDVILFGCVQRMTIDEHTEFHEVFPDSRISELGFLLAHWFPP